MSRVNAFLDRLPRTRVGACSREAPAFRVCGVTGFYLAVAAVLAGGLLAGRELLVLAALCVVCALSFFAYVYLRRWLTGRETLVLLEQVWTAEACCALALAALRVPVLPYLDVIGPALALFLACGRVGCLLAGCCHGRPSELGVVYGAAAARDGFPRHLVGVRLFPVQALEAAGLALIGLSGLAALPGAVPGRVFAWFLAGYGVLRFGTEALRGDRRPHWLGLSIPRWMALAEIGAACWITRGGGPAARDGAIALLLLATLAAALVARRRFDPRPALLSPAHEGEVRRAAAGAGDAEPGAAPAVRVTSAGVAVAVSWAGAGWLHVSLSHPGAPADLEALCALAAGAVPGIDVEGARADGGVLHLPVRAGATVDGAGRAAGDALYGAVVRRHQAEAGADRDPAEADEAPRRDYFRRARAAAGSGRAR